MNDINPNVVLTADNTQYDQAMSASADQTMKLGTAIDTVATKLKQISKTAGKGLLGIAAADAAVITATTAAYASYEKQMSQLNAQSAILSRTMTTQQRTMTTYTESVRNLRREFGTTTSEGAQLVQQLSKMSDGTAPIQRLAKTFTQMSNATGESSTQLASSVLGLQKAMGTSQSNTTKYTDQLTTLAAGANTSASALADFSAQLAPMGRLIGQSQTDITGVATAFTKAGQDGFQAASAYTKLVNDIAQATQTGSPELAKYANLVGMTTESFKQLSGTEQVTSFFDSITRQGPRAIVELNKLGYDGIRVVRSLTAMSQQTGGLGSSIQQARDSFGNGATEKGSKAAMEGITDEMGRLAETGKRIAEVFGSTFGDAMEKFLQGVNKGLKGIEALVNSPLGKIAGMVTGLTSAFAGLAGTLLTAASGLAAFAAFRGLTHNGLIAGFKAQGVANATTGGIAGVPDRPGGAPASFAQRWAFNAGAAPARMMKYQPGQAGSLLRQGVGYGMAGTGWGMRQLGYFYSPGAATVGVPDRINVPLTGRSIPMGPMSRFRVEGTGGYSNFLARTPVFNSPTLRGAAAGPVNWLGNTALGQGVRQGWAGHGFHLGSALAMGGTRLDGTPQFLDRSGKLTHIDQAREINRRADEMASKSRLGGAGSMQDMATKAQQQMAREASAAAKSMGDVGRQSMTVSRGLMSLGKGAGYLTTMLGATAGGVVKMGGQALSMLGMNPAMLAMMGGMAGWQMYQASTDDIKYSGAQSGFLKTYQDKYGLNAPPEYQNFLGDNRLEQERFAAMEITTSERSQARSDDYQFVNKAVKDASSIESAMAGVAAQWDTIKNSPEALHDLGMDWTARFGGNTAETMFGKMRGGQGEKVFNLGIKTAMGDAADAERKGFMDTITNTRSGSVTDDLLGEAYGNINARAAEIAATEGDAAAAQWRAQQMEGAIGFFQDEYGKGHGGTREVATVFNQATMDQLFGIDVSKKDVGYGLDRGLKVKGVESLSDFIGAQMGRGGLFDTNTDVKSVRKDNIERLEAALDSVGADTTLRGDKAEKALLAGLGGENIQTEEEGQKVDERIAGLSEAADKFISNPALQQAIEYGTGNVEHMYKAINSTFQGMIGQDPARIVAEMNAVRSEVRDDTSVQSVTAEGVKAAAGQMLQLQAPGMTRSQQFGVQADLIAAELSSPATTDDQQHAQDQAKQQFLQQVSAQDQYFRQMLLRQEEFDISRERAQYDFDLSRERMDVQYNLSRDRAQEDFHLSRKYQEEDYQTSRLRAEESYNRTRERGVESFDRSMRRSQRDFNISRRQQEEDHNHQVEQMIKQQAKSMMSAYERVNTMQTTSTSMLTVNMADQIEQLQKQTANLDAARSLGLSDEAIQQLDLTNADKAQQLERLVSDLTRDPGKVGKLNSLAEQKKDAAGELVTDESSNEWSEFMRSYELSRDRAMESFRRGVRDARKDFRIQMNQMEEDFRISMSQQAEDYEKSQRRQQEAFSKSMERSADDYDTAVANMTEDFDKSMQRAEEDFDRYGRTVAGNLEEIMTKAAKTLRGEVGKQARETLREFRELGGSLGDAGYDIMLVMSEVFGFEPPKKPNAYGKGSGPNGNMPDDNTGGKVAYAGGGTLPGRSVGRDNMHYYSPDHGELHLAGGEAIMVPEWVDKVGGPAAIRKMNDDARYGRRNFEGEDSFAKGGTVSPTKRVTMDGEPVSAITAAQILLAERLSGRNINVMQGSWQPYTSYSGSSHMGSGVVDTNPEDFETQAWLRKVGFAAWARNIPGAATAGSGAHIHAVSRLDPGAANHAQLSSFSRGEDGLGHPDYGPNPAMLPNISSLLGQFMSIAALTAGAIASGPQGTAAQLSSILKDYYPGVEADASKVDLGGGLFEDGWWSKKINRKARKAWKKLITGKKPDYSEDGTKWYATGGIFNTPTEIGVAEAGSEMVLPLDGRGASFISDVMHRSLVGAEGRAGNVQHSTPVVNQTHNYSIDKSTNFTGAITVQANDPGEFIQQLRARQRVMALGQASIGGARI